MKSAHRIVAARRHSKLDYADLKKLGVVLKRAVFFITCMGKMMYNTPIEENYITNQLVHNENGFKKEIAGEASFRQLSYLMIII